MKTNRKEQRRVDAGLTRGCGGAADTATLRLALAPTLDIFSGDYFAGAARRRRRTKKRRKRKRRKRRFGVGMADRDPVPLPAEVRAKLAELELELSEGECLNLGRGARRLRLRSLLLLPRGLSRCCSASAERTDRWESVEPQKKKLPQVQVRIYETRARARCHDDLNTGRQQKSDSEELDSVKPEAAWRGQSLLAEMLQEDYGMDNVTSFSFSEKISSAGIDFDRGVKDPSSVPHTRSDACELIPLVSKRKAITSVSGADK
ncbi:hypothetical protein F2P81_000137 [Scophthalmus maximus]|uniref:Uncharacterized protein n=1 Tax=Scophthalmus maximus TaxID=52904 RepID=A0A6A4TTE3_SCOMX|nr:hypothetical protein F2P81_000137 [Scophthalmus maximus]